jgi:hypothetical protein
MEAEMFARLTKFAVVALALAAGGQAKASPLSYGTYYDEEFVAQEGCGDISCRVNFSQLPSNNLFLLKKINCIIVTSQPITYLAATISETSGGPEFGRGIYVSPGPAVVTSGPLYNYSFQTDAQILIGQGRFPYIQAGTQGTSTFQMSCGILGDLVTPISG